MQRREWMLFLAALIWGCAFVAQSVSMDYIGPWTFTCIRSFIAGITLFCLMPVLKDHQNNKQHNDKQIRQKTILGGILCGCALCAASMFQQYGIMETTVGKAGFITALYVIIVPFMGIFLKKKIHPIVFVSALLSLCGMYLLCMKDSLSLSKGDSLVLICAFLFAVHIMVIDHFSDCDGIVISCIQFFTAGVICLIPMIVLEHPELSSIKSALIPILYAGIMSSGAGYTLQIIGQKTVEPSTASLILSLESVFAALAAWVLIHESLSFREILGCLLVFIAIILAEIGPDLIKKGSPE